MKLYISADIEGITDVTVPEETRLGHELHKEAKRQMTAEVGAACRALEEVGVREIVVKDAHASALNIDHRSLTKNTVLIRGWSGSKLSMMQELDESFDAVAFIGYHDRVTSGANPLAHTINGSLLEYIKLNDECMSEFSLNRYMANYFDIPVIFISGDKAICNRAKAIDPEIETVAVKEGKGRSTINIHPDLACDKIEEAIKKAIKKDLKSYRLDKPKDYKLEIRYRDHGDLEKGLNYPGTKALDSKTLNYETKDFMELLQAVKILV